MKENIISSIFLTAALGLAVYGTYFKEHDQNYSEFSSSAKSEDVKPSATASRNGKLGL